jgi:hypothetical protein
LLSEVELICVIQLKLTALRRTDEDPYWMISIVSDYRVWLTRELARIAKWRISLKREDAQFRRPFRDEHGKSYLCAERLFSETSWRRRDVNRCPAPRPSPTSCSTDANNKRLTFVLGERALRRSTLQTKEFQQGRIGAEMRTLVKALDISVVAFGFHSTCIVTGIHGAD